MHLTASDSATRHDDSGLPATTMRFNSDPVLLPGICSAAADFVAASRPSEVPKFTLVLRELLYNAIEHGNLHDASRSIVCEITKLGPECAEIAVTDEGAGFAAPDLGVQFPELPANSLHRGLRLVNALSSHLRFEEGGRRVVCRVSWSADDDPAPELQRRAADNPTKEQQP